MRLTSYLEDEDIIKFKGEKIKLCLSFDNVLKAYELVEDKMFTESEKMVLWLNMFVEDAEVLTEFNEYELSDLLIVIFNKLSTGEPSNDEDTKRLFDFEQDAEIIYSSFKADYGIDLLDEQGKMHWFKFISLLKGLTDKSQFKEVVNIRGSKIPKKTKYNTEERERLIKLKELYSLKESELDQKQRVKAVSNKLDAWGQKLIQASQKK